MLNQQFLVTFFLFCPSLPRFPRRVCIPSAVYSASLPLLFPPQPYPSPPFLGLWRSFARSAEASGPAAVAAGYSLASPHSRVFRSISTTTLCSLSPPPPTIYVCPRSRSRSHLYSCLSVLVLVSVPALVPVPVALFFLPSLVPCSTFDTQSLGRRRLLDPKLLATFRAISCLQR